MTKKDTLRTTFGILFLIISAIGSGLDILQVTTIEQKWLLVIIPLIGIGLLSWQIFSMKSQLSERPHIRVEPVKEQYNYNLIVTNQGQPAVFTAKIKSISNDKMLSDLDSYTGSWDTHEISKAEILKGQSAKIKIAEIIPDRYGSNMNLFYCIHPNTIERKMANPYLPRTTTDPKTGIKRNLPTPASHYLDITISSIPSLREGLTCPPKTIPDIIS